jgi:hypothetical protein
MSNGCVRRAWLTLGGRSLELEGPFYYCESLDLGYPEARAVVNNRPGQDGTDDRTAFMGARVVQANISALAPGVIDEIAASFGPYMIPSARPVLHYILDRAGAEERTLTLRASGYAWPIVGAVQRAISLQWVAPDPIVRGPEHQSTTAWAGVEGGGGRAYDLVPDRVYPPGVPQTLGQVTTDGDVPARPVLRVYGPITQADVLFHYYSGADVHVPFKAGKTIPAGDFVEVDTATHEAWYRGDRTRSVLSWLDWTALSWPAVPPLPDGAALSLRADPSGTVTSGVTQVQATWQDGYLS